MSSDNKESPSSKADRDGGSAPPSPPAVSTEPQGDGAPQRIETSGVLGFPVVGLGASAGGLQALEALFKRISVDSMAFVVVQHLAPDHESLLTNLIGRSTRMSVLTASDGARVS